MAPTMEPTMAPTKVPTMIEPQERNLAVLTTSSLLYTKLSHQMRFELRRLLNIYLPARLKY